MEKEDIVRDLSAHGARIISAEKRIKDLEDFQRQQNELVISVNKLANNMEQMLNEQKNQSERLKILEQEPAKRWTDAKKAMFNALLGAFGTAAAGFVLWLVRYVIVSGGM